MSGGPLSVRVARKSIEAEDICSLELVSADGAPLPAFAAGSHVDVQLPGGPTRQYSLCNDPAETHRYLIAVLRDPATRGGSLAMHDKVQVGDLLQISAPKNHFALAHEAKSHLLLAGGIGGLIIFLLWDIQPIRSTLKKMPAWNFVGRKMKKNLA